MRTNAANTARITNAYAAQRVTNRTTVHLVDNNVDPTRTLCGRSVTVTNATPDHNPLCTRCDAAEQRAVERIIADADARTVTAAHQSARHISTTRHADGSVTITSHTYTPQGSIVDADHAAALVIDARHDRIDAMIDAAADDPRWSVRSVSDAIDATRGNATDAIDAAAAAHVTQRLSHGAAIVAAAQRVAAPTPNAMPARRSVSMADAVRADRDRSHTLATRSVSATDAARTAPRPNIVATRSVYLAPTSNNLRTVAASERRVGGAAWRTRVAPVTHAVRTVDPHAVRAAQVQAHIDAIVAMRADHVARYMRDIPHAVRRPLQAAMRNGITNVTPRMIAEWSGSVSPVVAAPVDAPVDSVRTVARVAVPRPVLRTPVTSAPAAVVAPVDADYCTACDGPCADIVTPAPAAVVAPAPVAAPAAVVAPAPVDIDAYADDDALAHAVLSLVDPTAVTRYGRMMRRGDIDSAAVAADIYADAIDTLRAAGIDVDIDTRTITA